jgi:hypothetical protein
MRSAWSKHSPNWVVPPFTTTVSCLGKLSFLPVCATDSQSDCNGGRSYQPVKTKNHVNLEIRIAEINLDLTHLKSEIRNPKSMPPALTATPAK